MPSRKGDHSHLRVAEPHGETRVYNYDIDIAHVVCIFGARVGEQIPLVKKRIRIGRDPESDIVLDDGEVSNSHAEIVREGGTYLLRDAGSRNGIEYGGEIIDEVPLSNGDEFSICRHRFRFVWEGEEKIDAGGDILGRSERNTEVSVVPSRRRRRIPMVAVGGLLVGVVLVAAWVFGGTDAPRVTVSPVLRGPLEQSTTFSGKLVPRAEVRVFAAVSAPVEEVLVKEGQQVKKGTPLLRLDPAMLGMAVQRAQAELSAGHAGVSAAAGALRSAERKLREDRALARKGILSRAEVERSQSTVNARRSERQNAVARQRMAETSLAQAKRNHRDATVRAPIAGRVTTINIKVGEAPHDLGGIPVATIEDASELFVELSASEAKVGLLRSGQKATIRVSGAGLGTEFAGRVVQVAPKAEAPSTIGGATRYTAKIALEKQDPRLRPGMQVQVRITTARKKDALTVPLSAVVIGGRTSSGLAEQVAVVDRSSQRIKWVGIETDLIGAQRVEVIAGPNEGELIVSGPVDLLLQLKQGTVVEIVTAP